MSESKVDVRSLLRFVVALVSAGLISLGLAAPSQSATTTPATDSTSNELIDSIIVKYEPGVLPVDGSGNPTGEAAVFEDVDLTAGKYIGLGYRTIKLDQPIPVADAQKVADDLVGTSAIAVAEPDFALTIESDDFSTSALTNQILANDNTNWGLDRIDQSARPLDRSYSYFGSGTGVDVYIADSGVRSTHSEFQNGSGSRVKSGYSAFVGDPATSDCNGHGTHVAGIAAGKTYGVARSADIFPVKVLSCSGSGSSSTLISGINWIISIHMPGQPAVANFSLGTSEATGRIQSVDDAMAALINDGVIPVVAAGNGNAQGVAQNSCDYSPANSPGPISIGASTISDGSATFSNYGLCTDIYAPGSGIYSAGITSDSQIVSKSGTSMAAPFVAGVLSNILQENTTATFAQAWEMLKAEAVSAIPSDGRGSPTILLHQPPSGWSASSLAEQARLRVVAAEQAAAAQAAVQAAAEKAAADAAAAAEAQAAVERAAAEAAAAEIASRTIKVKTRYLSKVLASRVGVPYTAKASVTLTVAKASKKICTVSSGRLRTLKPGNCVVTIKVQEPKPRKGKRPAATKAVKTFIVQ